MDERAKQGPVSTRTLTRRQRAPIPFASSFSSPETSVLRPPSLLQGANQLLEPELLSPLCALQRSYTVQLGLQERDKREVWRENRASCLSPCFWVGAVDPLGCHAVTPGCCNSVTRSGSLCALTGPFRVSYSMVKGASRRQSPRCALGWFWGLDVSDWCGVFAPLDTGSVISM